MSIAMDSYCMQCYLKRNLELVRPLGPEEKTIAFAKELMKQIVDSPSGVPSPWFGPIVTDILCRMYGLEEDRFLEEKTQSNLFVLDRLSSIQATVSGSSDPVYAGLQFAVLGNYLDFSALQGNVSFDTFSEMLSQAKQIELDPAVYVKFCSDMDRAKKLLYITDNAGEIGFDRVCAEAIAQRWPEVKITFCVRGGVIQNDATREDAAQMGVPFDIIDSGSRIAGTWEKSVGSEAREALENADVILAKGMGNTETMYGCGRNVYYAFLIKCPRFELLFDRPMFTPMFIKET